MTDPTEQQIEAAAVKLAELDGYLFPTNDPDWPTSRYVRNAKAALTAAREAADKSAYVEALNYAHNVDKLMAAAVERCAAKLEEAINGRTYLLKHEIKEIAAAIRAQKND